MNQNEIRLMSDRKRPEVEFSGTDGNTFTILGRVRTAMREVGWTNAEIAEAIDDMMTGDYNNLLCTVGDYCEVLETQEKDDINEPTIPNRN